MRPLPLGAALSLHLALAALLAAAPPLRLPQPPEPLAVDLVAAAVPEPVPDPVPEPLPAGGPDPQEATPGPAAPAMPSRALSAPLERVPAAPSRIVAAPTPRATPPSRRTAPAPPNPVAGDAGIPAAAIPTEPRPDEIAAWQAAMSAWVDRHRRYPPAARFRQEEGVVRVRFELDAAGRVRHVALESGSGSSALDQAALSLLDGATMPAPPPGLAAARRTISLPIRYRLE